MLRLRKNFDKVTGQARRSCRLCGVKYKRVELSFTNGTTQPAVGETLTGAGSGCTGIVIAVEKISGEWANSNAVGYVELQSYAGADEEQMTCFRVGEFIDGGIGGSSIMKVVYGSIKIYGRLYPQNEMINDSGKWYCKEHYYYRNKKGWEDEVRPEVDEVTGED